VQLHTHPNLDETLIAPEGTEHRLGERGVAVALRGLPHVFMVASETACILTLQTPGSGEGFYRGVLAHRGRKAHKPPSLDT